MSPPPSTAATTSRSARSRFATLTGLNLKGARPAFGRDLAGILGQEICQTAVVEIDAARRSIRLHDPNGEEHAWLTSLSTDSESVRWAPIEMHNGLPHVRCRYGGAHDTHTDAGGEATTAAEGLFVIDTGSDGSVHFFGPAVARHDLLNSSGVRITGRRTRMCYTYRERVPVGTIASFRIGGMEIGPVEDVTFGDADDGAAGLLPHADGIIGVELLKRFVLVLDQPRGRLALLERPSDR